MIISETRAPTPMASTFADRKLGARRPSVAAQSLGAETCDEGGYHHERHIRGQNLQRRWRGARQDADQQRPLRLGAADGETGQDKRKANRIDPILLASLSGLPV